MVELRSEPAAVPEGSREGGALAQPACGTGTRGRPDLALPADLLTRQLPAQVSPFDGRAILAKTKLPARSDVVWTIELAPLTRMQAWGVAPIRDGETLEFVGYTLTDESEPVLRVEWLFRDGKVYGMRSSPA